MKMPEKATEKTSKKISRVQKYIESLKEEDNIMTQLKEELERKRKIFDATNVRTEFRHLDEKYERGIYEFEKSIQKETNLIKEHRKKMVRLDTTTIASAYLGDIIDQICKLKKIKRKDVIINVDTPCIYFGELTMKKLEELIKQGKISADFEITIYNKNYTGSPKFFYSKRVSINNLLQYRNGKQLHDIAYVSAVNGKTEIVFRNDQVEDIKINFTVKELTKDNSEWEPVSLMYNAVVNCACDEYII